MVFCAKIKKNLIIALVAAAVLTVIFCVAASSCVKKVNFNASFYYVCYKAPSDAHSASSMSSAVQSYGGAGYIVQYDGEYLVTVACYYKEMDADTVCKSLKNRGLSCFVVTAKMKEQKLKGSARRNVQKYEGNLKTLLSISEICYELANSLENLTCSQAAAKGVLSDVKKNIENLERSNAANCFSQGIALIKAECEDVSAGFILSREVRRLQIVIIDALLNVKLY